MTTFKKACSLAFFPIVFSSSLLANAPISIPKVDNGITIDASLDETQWRNATKVDVNTIVRPYENTDSPVKTEAYVMEDGETFYIAFIANDPNPENIRAFIKDRDKVWGDDLVGVKIDTYNDHRLAYSFWVNPHGVQNDSIENEMTKSESSSWDGIWSAKGKITDKGYIVEMALPLRMLNFNDNLPEQKWGLEFVRFYPREQRYRISNVPTDRNNSCSLCQLVEGHGFSGAKQGDNLTIVPAVVSGRSEERDLDDIEAGWDSDNNTELSLDLRWGITPNLLLNATINPDFSTIESDSAQLSINNNFALFNQEKRPFFLDNADYFSTNFNLVYTRNVNAPDYGAKLTGRRDAHSVGVFVANDKDTNVLIPGNNRSTVASLDGKSKNASLRYRYDHSQDLSIGWITTARFGEDYQNTVNGIDSKYRLGKSDVIKGQVIHSTSEYPLNLSTDLKSDDDCSENSPFKNCQFNESANRTLGNKTYSGTAAKIAWWHNDRDWEYNARYQKTSDGFRADLGFMGRTDSDKLVFGGARKWYGESNQWWNLIKLSGDWDIAHNNDGELLEKEIEAWFTIEGARQSKLRTGIINRDRVGLRYDRSSLAIKDNTSLFSTTEYRAFFEIKPFSNLYYNTQFVYGEEIDFSNDRIADVKQIRPHITWNINDQSEMVLRHTFKRLDTENENVFIARLSDFKFTYQFNINSFVRLNLILNNTDRNPNNYLYTDVDKNYSALSTQLLYAYKINPQTVFYAGYSDHSYSDIDLSDLKKDARNVFLKVSYAWLK